MIACILSSLLEITPTAVGIETKRETEIEERIRTKQSGRYEVLTHLPTTADSLDTMFAYAKAIGVIRTAYIHKDIINGAATNALAFGGQFGFETAQYEGFSTRVLAYTSQNLNSGYYTGIENGDFFGIDKEGFTYIAEANLAYANRWLQIVAGRERVETPFADSDDNRMAPNSFEGAWSNINMSESLSFQALYFSRWAGAGSQIEDNNGVVEAPQNDFKEFTPDSQGMAAVALSYQSDNNEYGLWYYYVDRYAHMMYAEALGSYEINHDASLDWGLQVSNFEEMASSGVGGLVSGGLLILHYNKFYGGGAFNYASVSTGKNVSDGFGGGPYFTSLDEASVAAVSEIFPGQNVLSYRLGMGYTFDAFGDDNLVLELMHGHFIVQDNSVNIDENDVIISYEISDSWYGELVYANFHDVSNDNFDRAVLRLDYSF